MVCDVARLARLLDSLVVARTVYELVGMGFNPSTLYRYLRWLVDYGFVNAVYRDGRRYYHLTGLGARLLDVLLESLLYRFTRMLEERGVRYKVWWGDERVRAARPVVYVDRPVDVPAEVEGLVEVRVVQGAGKEKDEGGDRRPAVAHR